VGERVEVVLKFVDTGQVDVGDLKRAHFLCFDRGGDVERRSECIHALRSYHGDAGRAPS
jgi:hypothetical protein